MVSHTWEHHIHQNGLDFGESHHLSTNLKLSPAHLEQKYGCPSKRFSGWWFQPV